MIIKNRFMPIHVGIFKHKKILFLENNHPDISDNVMVSIWKLWNQCHFFYQDGVLYDDASGVEMMAEWKGKPGKLIEILTSERTRFLDKISDNEYHVHNWFKRNSLFDPERNQTISEQKSNNANKRWLKRDLKQLEDNGVELKKCKWLEITERGKLGVEYKYLPDHIKIGREEFFTKAAFTEANKHQDPEVQNKRKDLIKRHTKRCTKCNKIHVNSKHDICYKCQGK